MSFVSLRKVIKLENMKAKPTFLLMLILLFGFHLHAQSIPVNGSVFNLTEKTPVANHPVYFLSNGMADTLVVFTNDEGLFTANIPVNSDDAFYILIYTVDPCTGRFHKAEMYPYTSNNYFEFYVCGNEEPGCNARFEYYSGMVWNDTIVYNSDSTTYGEYPVYFYDQSLGIITSWFWDFGDGTSSTGQNPVHNYPQEGEYLVALYIEGPNCNDSIVMQVWVADTDPGCYAYFYYDFGSSYGPDGTVSDSSTNDLLTVYFYDYSTGEPTYWKWDFGDGFASEEQNPTHTYAAPGEYYVNLYISGEDCDNWFGMPIWVGNYEPPCQAMFGYDYFNWNDSVESNTGTGVADTLAIYFYNYSYGNYTGCKWNFGDGFTSTEYNPWHVYAQSGDYPVTLDIYGENCSSSYTLMVPVGTYQDTIWYPDNCQALFYPIVENDNKATFINQSYGDISNYYWDFGDGTTSNEVNPVHQYPFEGSYLVSLEVFTYDSCQSRFDMELWVGTYDYDSSLNALFIPEINGTVVTFHDRSTGDIWNRYWDFGDGSSSTAKEPIHIYSESAVYYATLGISNGNAVHTFTMELNLIDGTFKGYYGDESSTGIPDNVSQKGAVVFPNPFKETCNVSFFSELSGKGWFKLYHVSGQMIYNQEIEMCQGMNQMELPTLDMKNGMYLIQIGFDHQPPVSKMILKQ
ncbi:MAG TPA: hypothetical protein DCQ26_16910 [Marinilabiliales bacterium]|nr:hypothetical protein [Marinilabiliales bacterium]HBX86809.1 hypothetical protein [Marinilabiliales bacterium]HBY54810.1 hypothetical protein [Marinilabiliales bacterium]HCC28450.1 hypothetical protein [Marinilabiliales bacterium]